jgi:EAL domain-containing protein (putative c-di-GMP-specific phosphodiesterase class I)
VQLSINDFGTGYSSLSYLHRFPVDSLKIDRSFIGCAKAALPYGKKEKNINVGNLEIIGAIIALARNLNVHVIAEGVETPEQMEQLRHLECEYGQGHLFAAPVDSRAAQSMITHRKRW